MLVEAVMTTHDVHNVLGTRPETDRKCHIWALGTVSSYLDLALRQARPHRQLRPQFQIRIMRRPEYTFQLKTPRLAFHILNPKPYSLTKANCGAVY